MSSSFFLPFIGYLPSDRHISLASTLLRSRCLSVIWPAHSLSYLAFREAMRFSYSLLYAVSALVLAVCSCTTALRRRSSSVSLASSSVIRREASFILSFSLERS